MKVIRSRAERETAESTESLGRHMAWGLDSAITIIESHAKARRELRHDAAAIALEECLVVVREKAAGLKTEANECRAAMMEWDAEQQRKGPDSEPPPFGPVKVTP